MQNISVNGDYLENIGCEGFASVNTDNQWPCIMPLEELQSRGITRINDLKFDLYINSGNQQIAILEGLTISR
jgi:hypothetical protein